MYTSPGSDPCCNDLPSNTNPRDEALKCVTDLVDCCGTESGTKRTERGDWYFPDGRRVGFDGNGPVSFQANRGPNEVINGQTVQYGSVRLYRRYGAPPERGRFRCELPSAANFSVNQTLYVNISELIMIYTEWQTLLIIIVVNFGYHFNVDHVTISAVGSNTAGETYLLNCSAILFEPSCLPSDVPSPNFQWSFNGSASLPSGVTAMPTIMSSSNSTSETYTSILQFSPLSECHTGSYTCRLGPGRLMNSTMVTINGIIL